MKVFSKALNLKHQHYIKYEIVDSMDIYLINNPVDFYGMDYGFIAWLLIDKKNDLNIVVEIGPAAAIDIVKDTIDTLGVEKIDYILLTHIHLDHAGGLGHILKYYPEAMVYASEKGRKHIVYPDKLWESSVKVLGKKLTDAYQKTIGISEKNVLKEKPIIEGLSIIETPGHAPHHETFIFEREGSQLIFCGEAAGMIYGIDERKLVLDEGIDSEPDFIYLYPATIYRFEYEVSENSLKKLISSAQDENCYLFYSHYGIAENGKNMLESHLVQLTLWKDMITREVSARIEEGMDPLEKEFLKGITQHLIESDPYLGDYVNYKEDVRRAQYRYILNSVYGIADWAVRNNHIAQN
jgi:glyoxylase-like metal-dependent hydrolase (beta-lactamase superfamily II)